MTDPYISSATRAGFTDCVSDMAAPAAVSKSRYAQILKGLDARMRLVLHPDAEFSFYRHQSFHLLNAPYRNEREATALVLVRLGKNQDINTLAHDLIRASPHESPILIRKSNGFVVQFGLPEGSFHFRILVDDAKS